MRTFSPGEAEQLIGLSQQNLRGMRRDQVLMLGEDRGNRIVYSYDDLLAIEAARQLNAQGLSWKRAFEIIAMSGAIGGIADHRAGVDFWACEMHSLHADGQGQSTAYHAGSLSQITEKIRTFKKGDRYHPDSPSEIIMVNISGADRRIKTRASEASIEIEE